MTIAKSILLAGAIALGASVPGWAQERSGESLFRERCSECHGSDAKGVTGHDLTRLWASGATDERVFQTIRQGVPNTIMPSSSAPDADLRALVTYLRSLNATGGTAPVARGNAQHGEQIFWQSCGSCHAVQGRGGPLGPDLTRIAPNQSRETLVRAVRDPNAAIPDGYRPITVVTREGQRIRGVSKSEDAFSIQMMDQSGRLRGFLKSSIREVVHETNSLMPAFGPDRLNDSDLADVLAFLSAK
jgi:putative heme-binding domain-containing protein